MKMMKTLLKLVFVGVLACVTVTLPSRAHAQSGQWTCNTAEMNSCIQSASQWMGQCIGQCPTQGSPQEYCYQGEITVCNDVQCNNGSTPETTTVCFDGASSGESCDGTCTTEMDALLQQCKASYCWQE